MKHLDYVDMHGFTTSGSLIELAAQWGTKSNCDATSVNFQILFQMEGCL